MLRDLRYAFRMLGKTPGLTAILVLTLALGIGVNTAIFSVLNGWLLRPLPVPDPGQIMALAFQQKERGSDSKFSYPDLVDLRKQATAVFSDLFAYRSAVGGLTYHEQSSLFAYCDVTGDYFTSLGVKPLLGRLFLPGEGEQPRAPVSVVLGYAYWQRNFGGDPGIVGKQVLVDGRPATVLGITPPEFHGTFFAFDMDGYLPLSATALEMSSSGDTTNFWTNRRSRSLTVFGRLKPGVNLAQSQASMDVIARRLATQYPETDKDAGVRVIPEPRARPAPFVTSFVPVIAGLFLALAGLVLLLACLNVANILLSRATARSREMAIRASLGAGRGRLVRQMLTESLLLALLGTAAGVVLGAWAINGSGSMLNSVTSDSAGHAFHVDTSFDWKVFSYTLSATLFTGLFVGLWPALGAGRADLHRVLSAGGRSHSAGGRQGFRGALVIAQVAGSLMLLIVAGLLVRSIYSAHGRGLGYDPGHILNVMVDPHQIGYDQARTKAFYRELERRARSLPSVQSASLSYTAPMGFPSHAGPIYVESHPLPAGRQPPVIAFNSIDPAYVDTMRVPLLRGRKFTDADKETARQVAIVNQAMAKKLWPGEDPIGKRFSFTNASGPFVEVVGIAGNGQYFFLSQEPQPYFFVPLDQNYASFGSLQIRTSVPPETMITAIQGLIRQLEPNLPIFDLRTAEQMVNGIEGFLLFRLAASIAMIMGTLGLVLAVMGVYGIVSFAVSRRTQEIGIRMALGAEARDILKLVSQQALRLILAGVAAGAIAAAFLTRAMSKLLIGVAATDPLTYGTVALLLSVVAAVACWIPARRALRVDPMTALRYE